MVLAVAPSKVELVRTRLEEAGEDVLAIGRIVEGDKGCTVRGSQGTWSAKEDWEAVHLG